MSRVSVAKKISKWPLWEDPWFQNFCKKNSKFPFTFNTYCHSIILGDFILEVIKADKVELNLKKEGLPPDLIKKFHSLHCELCNAKVSNYTQVPMNL